MNNNTSLKSSSREKDNILLRIYRNPYFRYIIFGAILALIPIASGMNILPSSYITIMGSVMIYSIVGIGLNLLLGYSGLISLGTAGFMGLAAYVTGYLSVNVNAPFIVALAVSIFVVVLIGVIVGFVSLRVAGIYLAIATLCVSEILRKTFEELEWLTNGFSGLNASFPRLFGIQLNRKSTYFLIVVVLILVMMLTHNLVKGQMGRALHAMRESEVAAQAMGVNLLKYRLVVFAIATAYAAIGGALYIFFIRFSIPGTWTMALSLNILGAVVIGGLRSIYGTVIGCFVIFAIPDIVLKPLFGDVNGLQYVFSGLVVILVILFYPAGVKNMREDFFRLCRFLKKKINERKGKGEIQ
ncbi:MAG: branched-chain amino acid ABC transporter permease [Parasporobacterium sp.]|nr:branched-chain amino acid ABC transporter permease [Parasporobacterium sp.]